MQHVKILVIPSWFPTKSAPYTGIFFKVQTELMRPQYDMRILAGNPLFYGRKKLLKYFTCPKIKPLNGFFIETEGLIPFQFKQLTLKSDKNCLLDGAKAYLKALMVYMSTNNWKPDLIHAHDTFWGGYYASYISKKLNIPFIITHHNPLIFANFELTQKKILKETIEAAHELLCVSNFDKRTFLISGYKVNPIFVGNFIDEDKFKLKADLEPTKKYNLFSVGIASKRKDFPTLLKAMQALVHKYKQRDVFLTLSIAENISDGISVSEIKQIASELKINEYCKFVSNLSLNELVHEYQKADLFVSSSYFETFGVAVCEAMCCGTPVVAINNGGIDDIINSNNGVRVSLGDYENMAEVILKIKNKSISFNKQNVRDSIIQKYGREAFFNKISNVYNSIVDIK